MRNYVFWVTMGLCLVKLTPNISADWTFQRGDTNDSSAVDIADAVNVLDYLFSFGPAPCLDALDVNDSGGVDIADSVYVLSYLFSVGESPHPPFPNCGPDPTLDPLDCAGPLTTCPVDALPPEIISIPFTIANPDAPYEYIVSVAPTSDPVTFFLTTGPVNATIDASTGLVQWLPNDLDVGAHEFVVGATTVGGAAEQSFTVTVYAWPGAPQLVAVTSPTQALQAFVSGTAPGATTVEFVNDGVVLSVPTDPGGAFIELIDLSPNSTNLIHVRGRNAADQVSAPTTVLVVQDSQSPELFIDEPGSGSVTFDSAVDVLGRVSDMLSGYVGLLVFVSVNGGPVLQAEVDEGIGTNGTFFLPQVSLEVGLNTIEVFAQDAAGNPASAQIEVTRVELAADNPVLSLLDGNGQSETVLTDLEQPLVVRVIDGAGAAFANKVVTFRVARSDGRLRAPGAPVEDGRALFQTFTDSEGEAAATWRLGSDAGSGNNRVKVTSAGVQNSVLFCASATAGAPVQLNVGGGNGQRGEVGTPAELPLCAWVSDSCNGVSGVETTFTITRGNGLVNGGATATVTTDSTGHAEVSFRYGSQPGNNTVMVNTASNTGASAVFTLRGVVRDESTPTRFSGVVLSNAKQPIEGATCTLEIPGQSAQLAVTTADGRFEYPAVMGDGPADFFVDGSTATAVGGRPLATGSFPHLHFEPILVPNAANTLAMPVLLPPLNLVNERTYSTTEDTILTVEGVAGLRMTIKAGSMTLASGTPAPDGTSVSLNIVHHDDVPMPMPDGAAPPFAWTLQPALATFDPPIAVEYPNMSGLPPGAIANFLTFSHDTGKFEIFASGTVNEDGAIIRTDPQDGLTLAGWGCNCPPYSVTGSCRDCTPKPNGCGSAGTPNAIVEMLNCFTVGCPLGTPQTVCFTEACRAHDICYGTCGASRLDCDIAFRNDMLDICSSLRGQNCIVGDGLAEQCERKAWVYFRLVRAFGNVPYGVGQIAACACEIGLPLPLTASLAGEAPPFDDVDEDFLPDDWELEVGLDPTDPLDSLEDPDQDDLTNLEEYVYGMDPFEEDTLGTGIGDFAEVTALQPAAELQLDESWTVTVNGQVASVESIGTFRLDNVSSADSFGGAGPGSPPDGLSDDFVRVVGSRSVVGETHYAISQPFQIVQGQDFVVTDLTLTDTPPPLPESLRFEPATAALLEIDDTEQLQVTGVLGDGSEVDLTPTTSWTTYRSSNNDVVTVDDQGLVTAESLGAGFITATNDGAISVKRVDVTTQIIATVVVGLVHLSGGIPVENATVTLLCGAVGSGTTDTAGSVSISGSASFDAPTICVRIDATVGADEYGAFLTGIPVVGDGLTDFGIATLELVDPELAGHWKFDEGSGSTAVDASSNGNDGLSTAPIYDATEVAPIDGNSSCLVFDGNDFVNVPNDPSLNPTTEVTVACWIRRAGVAGFADPIVKKSGPGQSNGYALEFSASPNTTLRFWVFRGSWTSSSAAPIPFDEWTHVAGVYDGSSIRMYVNGVQVGGSVSATGTIGTATNPLYIGRDPSNPSRYFDGRIDDVRVFTRSLSEVEIMKLATPAP